MEKMDINNVFDAIGSQMLSDFEHFHSQIKHLGERGEERELALKSFLESYLPSRYAISNGEIVDVIKQTSPRCDLIVYDHANSPLLLAGRNYRVFPAEPVFAVIEVKSVLTVAELEDAVEKIRTIKKLERKNGSIGGIVFAYKSAWKKDAIQKIASHLQRINSKLTPADYIDMICVLNAGLIRIFSGDDDAMWCYYNLEIPPLLWFFINTLDFLGGKVSAQPNYGEYMSGGPFCLVEKMSPRLKM
jgi:hypothetical protein